MTVLVLCVSKDYSYYEFRKMFKIATALLFALLGFSTAGPVYSTGLVNLTLPLITPANNCVSFSVSPGTGCAWMCTYCATALGTSNYYFTNGVCTYQTGGCVGNPQTGVTYTCCSV